MRYPGLHRPGTEALDVMPFPYGDIEILVGWDRPIRFRSLIKQDPADDVSLADEYPDPWVVTKTANLGIVKEIPSPGSNRLRESVGPKTHLFRAQQFGNHRKPIALKIAHPPAVWHSGCHNRPMPQDPDDLIALSREQRFQNFIDTAKETGQLWTLAEEEALLVLGIEDHDEFVVVFPTSDVVGSWFETCGLEEADLVSMDSGDWIANTLDELSEGEVEICVFPTADDEGTFMTPDALKKALAA